jgi:valyl-tRNA synthetase
MESRYDPHRFEGEIYRRWEAAGFGPRGEGRPFVVPMPPPNVTGNLHIGHALDLSMQDALIRFHRMRGRQALWVPGTDHAGIATQAVVERRLAEEGTSRQALGREAFLERVWAWKATYEAEILHQLRALGASADWSRLRFTLDPGLSHAVRVAFVRLWEKGLIYRKNAITSWCPRCATVLSDIEVEHVETEGRLVEIRYPLADGEGSVTVATTRPETMLGDTAVAVHPGDLRYRHLVGRRVRVPLVGREIPVVADEAVEMGFGTGAVKVTPAHDPTDFAIAERHGLEALVVIDDAGRMQNVPAPYDGLDRFAARERVLEDLAREGALVSVRPYTHAVGHCSRCDTVVEPRLSPQWFVRMQPLARPALEAARAGRIRFWPERFLRVYEEWLENVRDWCISRQLWWGHRIPVWTCTACGETVVTEVDPDRCPRCGGRLEQEEDVLDTWFSSGLWPFATLGWPDESAPDLQRFYPTDTLVTGYDIIFFWVARMIFLGLAMTGREPFRDVVLHGLVRDAEGRKMSKSRGNGVDPLEVVRSYGADALRYALLTGSTPGQDIRFRQDRVLEGRNLCNKIWNAARFAGGVLEGAPAPATPPTRVDRWIQSRLAAAAQAATEAYEGYEVGEAGRAAQDFFWGELCDVYLEAVKPRQKGPERGRVAATLAAVLPGALKLLHPILPFVTEAVYQALPGTDGLLMWQPWPSADGRDPAVESEMATVLEAIRLIRHLKAEAGLASARDLAVEIRAEDGAVERLLGEEAGLIAHLTRTTLRFVTEAPSGALSARLAGAEIYLPLGGLVDVEAEIRRIEREIEGLRKDLAESRARLADEMFRTRAPAAVVAKEEERRQALEARLALAEERAALFRQAR